ncbi:hypothetical protein [Pseudomonas laurentiana]
MQFDALLAGRLDSQSLISCDDPLFLRMGRGLVPAARANEIVKALEPAIQGVEEVFDRYLRQAADERKTFFLVAN